MSNQECLHGVSVVIPTLNRAEELADTVRDILNQNYRDFELIIVDQSAEINHQVLSLLAAGNIPCRYFHAQFRGLPLARNFGWRQAKNDIVLYIDDDIRCGQDFVGAHYQAHQTTQADLIAGGIDEAKGNGHHQGAPGSFNPWLATSIRNFHHKTPGWCLHGPGGNFSIRRRVLAEIGGFDEALTIGAALYEETELALRLKQAAKKAWFAPEARLLHLAAPMGGCRVKNDWARYMYGLAHNRTLLIFRHLRCWYWPTALLRLLMLGVSYSRLDASIRPLLATLRAVPVGFRAALSAPVNAELSAKECTFY